MISIDPRLSKPIFQQIVDNMKEGILKGIIKQGEKIPSVRELAILIQTNPNTVNKAYKELERQKIILTIQGKGSFVSENYNPKVDHEKLEIIKSDLKKIIVESEYMGIDKRKLIEMIQKIYDEIHNRKEDL